MTPTPTPSGWTSTDIGAPALSGSGSVANGIFTVQGSGLDIYNQQDQFQFFWQSLSGDGQIVARVTSISNSDPWAKAGVMIRQTLTDGSPYAMMSLSQANGAIFHWRPADSVATSYSTSSWTAPPVWLKLVRSGSAFTGFISGDGVSWTQVGTATVPMNQEMEAGLGVTSHNSSALCTATFDNVVLLSSQDIANRLNPAAGFRVQLSRDANGNSLISWPAVPGTTYVVQYCDTLGASWTVLPGSQMTAAPGQLSLSLSDTTAPPSGQRFYRVQVLGL